MDDMVRKAFRLGLGMIVVTQKKVESMVNEFVEKGDIGKEEGEKFVKEFLEKGEESEKQLEAKLEKMLNQIVVKLNMPTRQEFKKLESKVSRLEKELSAGKK